MTWLYFGSEQVLIVGWRLLTLWMTHASWLYSSFSTTWPMEVKRYSLAQTWMAHLRKREHLQEKLASNLMINDCPNYARWSERIVGESLNVSCAIGCAVLNEIGGLKFWRALPMRTKCGAQLSLSANQCSAAQRMERCRGPSLRHWPLGRFK